MAHNQKGMALLMALFTVVILSYLAVEVSYEAGIEYRLSKNVYDELKAKYAAKSGMEISLLRISLYKKVYDKFGSQVPDPSLLDLIWNFPFSWPPALPDEASLAAKEELKSILSDTSQDAAWSAAIQSEGRKIDINDIYSPSESLAKATQKKVYNIFQQRLNADDDWAQENRNLKIEELVDNLVDWIDPDSNSPHAGSEDSLYRDITEIKLPPNSDFKTVEELHMVAGFTDDIYDILAPNITVFGIKGINVNYADKEQLKAIDPQINEEVVKEILKRRSDPNLGPFKDLNDFEGFIQSYGVDLNDFNTDEMPLRFDKEFNFRIQSIGMFGNVRKEITAIVYDFTNAKVQLQKILEEDVKKQSNNQQQPSNSQQQNTSQQGQSQQQQNNQQQQKKDTYDKGRPRILYWKES